MQRNIIDLNNITKYYGKTHVLKELNLHIPQNSITALIGPNGCGKTTLFKVVLGITDHEKGELKKIPNDRIGFMIDDCRPYDRLTLYQNMIAVSILSGKPVSKTAVNEIIASAFCGNIKNKPFKTLSSGQQKKALFALSLINDPEVLILDEPLNSLDLKEKIDIISSLKYINKAGNKTIIVSSHDLDSLYELCDFFCFIKNGRIFLTKEKKDICSSDLGSIFLDIYE